MFRAALLGLAGAFAAQALGLPAAPLLGASLAVAAGGVAGWRLSMPVVARNAGFLGIGLSLGAGVGPSVLAHLGDWAVSLLALALSLLTTLALGTALLKRLFLFDKTTAALASSPGTMSYALAVAEECRADIAAVLVIQSLRLLALASALPIAVRLFLDPPAPAAAPELALAPLLALGLAGVGLAWGFARLSLPAAWLIGGFTVSACAHLAGLVAGALPAPLAFLCFTLTGTTIGTRFSGLARATLKAHVKAALAVAVLASAVSAGFAALTHALTGLPLAQIWIALAPGGVEAMAAIGLALGYDPAYIALHHLARIAFLILFVPLFIRR